MVLDPGQLPNTEEESAPDFDELNNLYKRLLEARTELEAVKELHDQKIAEVLQVAIGMGKKTKELDKIVPIIGNTPEDHKELAQYRAHETRLTLEVEQIRYQIDAFNLQAKVYLDNNANGRKRFI